MTEDGSPAASSVWVFLGDGPRRPPSAVFSELSTAEAWIRRAGVSGLLTRYPLDVSVYDWVQANGYWQPKRDEHRAPEYVQNFSSAYLEHVHYRHGRRSDGAG